MNIGLFVPRSCTVAASLPEASGTRQIARDTFVCPVTQGRVARTVTSTILTVEGIGALESCLAPLSASGLRPFTCLRKSLALPTLPVGLPARATRNGG